MKVLSLGGVGAVAKEATRDLVEFSDFDEIVIGDYAEEKAAELARELGDSRVSVLKVDAGDEDSLRAAIKKHDVVMNGLPFKYDYVVNKICVEEGIPGVDLSSEDPQFALSREAEAKGMLFIPGCGATPGITNIMARRGVEQMDTPEEIYINFAAFRCLAPAPGLLTTTLYEFKPVQPDRCYYVDGKYVEAPSMTGGIKVKFHDQIGEQTVVFVPHDEVWTIPESFPGLKKVEVRGCFPPQVMSLMRGMLDAGLFSEDEVVVEGVKTTPWKMMNAVLLQLPETRQNPVWAYGLHVVVVGKKNGRHIKCTYDLDHPSQDDWGAPASYFKPVGIPLSISAQMLAKGRCQGVGVRPPERAIPSVPFFEELAKRRIIVNEHIEETGPMA